MRDGGGGVAAGVINHDDRVHHALGHDFVVGLDEGFGRVISGHDYDNFLFANHSGCENTAEHTQNDCAWEEWKRDGTQEGRLRTLLIQHFPHFDGEGGRRERFLQQDARRD